MYNLIIISINSGTFWFICAAILILLEVVAGFTVTLLFAALSAFTLGILIEINFVPQNNIVAHLTYFCGFTLFWLALFYKPLRELIKKHHNQNNYSNIVGNDAVVSGAGLKKGEMGQVKWSGSLFNAQIRDGSDLSEIAADQAVTIVEIKGNTFIVDKVK